MIVVRPPTVTVKITTAITRKLRSMLALVMSTTENTRYIAITVIFEERRLISTTTTKDNFQNSMRRMSCMSCINK